MMTTNDLQEKLNLVINKAKGSNFTAAQISTVLSTLVTALGSDTTLHSREIETPPAALATTLPRY